MQGRIAQWMKRCIGRLRYNIYRDMKRRPHLFCVGRGSLFMDGAYLECRGPEEPTRGLEVGEDSLVGAGIVIEGKDSFVRIGNRTYVGGVIR